jgi:toxin ParE1/3/4
LKQRVIIYSPEAGDDFDWIYDTIADLAGPLTASRYEQRIRAFCESLDLASERGQRRDDIRQGLRIVGFERRVTIAFSVDEERVIILRLLYGGVDWAKGL